jgi:hypothetical protein
MCLFLFGFLLFCRNSEKFDVSLLEVDGAQVSSGLSLVLHTILFNRCLGGTIPVEFQSAYFPSIVACRVDEESIKITVKNCIEKLLTALERAAQIPLHPNTPSNTTSTFSSSPDYPHSFHCSVILGFYDLQMKKNWLGQIKEEKVIWEKWVIPIQINISHNLPAAARFRTNLVTEENSNVNIAAVAAPTEKQARSVEAALFSIVKYANEKRDHLPSLKSNSQVCSYPFEVTYQFTPLPANFSHNNNTNIISSTPPQASELSQHNTTNSNNSNDSAGYFTTFKKILKNPPGFMK